MSFKRNKEFNLFVKEIENLDSQKDELEKNEINKNKLLYLIPETNAQRKEAEYYTSIHYKKDLSCFCIHSGSKKNYFKLEDAQYDAFSYKQFIYVCSPESKNRIYHLTSER